MEGINVRIVENLIYRHTDRNRVFPSPACLSAKITISASPQVHVRVGRHGSYVTRVCSYGLEVNIITSSWFDLRVRSSQNTENTHTMQPQLPRFRFLVEHEAPY